MDFMCYFPPEIIETILSYLNNDDLKNCLQVSRLWQRNTRDLCNCKIRCIKSNWYPNKSSNYSDRSAWQKCFWLNFNWHYGIYNKFNRQVCAPCVTRVALDLVVKIFLGYVEIWSFDVLPQLEQTITYSSVYSTVTVFEDFLFLYHTSSPSLQVYHRVLPTKKYKLYKEIGRQIPQIGELDSTGRCSDNVDTSTVRIYNFKMNEHYIVKSTIGHIFWVNIKNDSIWNILPNYHLVISMEIESNKLYIVILDRAVDCYKMKRYDMENKIWDLQLVLFKDTPFGNAFPEIWVNAYYIASIAPFQNRRLYSPLKVWNNEGMLLDCELPMDARKLYFHCCLKDSYVIYTRSESTITVWQPNTEEPPRHFNVIRGFENIRLVPGNAIALSYKNIIQIWDWKQGLCLYDVDCHISLTDTVSDFIKYFTVNDQYYINGNNKEMIVVKFSDRCETDFT